MTRLNLAKALGTTAGPFALFTLLALAIGCGGGGSTGASNLSTPPSSGSTSGVTPSTTSGTSGSGSSSSGTSTSGTSGTSGSSGSGTTVGTTGSGTLLSNTIYFSDNVYAQLKLRSVSPNGTHLNTIGQLPTGFTAAMMNPNAAKGVLFAYSATGSGVNLYQNTSLSMTGATQVGSTTFDSVSMLQPTSDGKFLVLVASYRGVAGLYTQSLPGGILTYLTPADTAAVSSDGSTIVFSQSKIPGEAIGTIPTSGGTVTLLTNGSSSDFYPQFSKDGATVVFSSDRNGSNSTTPYDLYTVNVASKQVTALNINSGASEYGASFNQAGNQISYVVVSGMAGQSGVYVCNADGTNSQLIYQSDSMAQSTYWTSQNGRGFGSEPPLFQRLLTKP